jgi:transcriptional regulator
MAFARHCIGYTFRLASRFGFRRNPRCTAVKWSNLAMHPNPSFRTTETAEALGIARARGFGMLSVNGDAGPLGAHIPFEIVDEPEGGVSVRVHLARSNAIARAGLPLPALLAVSGPDAYGSPDWYGAPDQVPTWNYVAVHLRGFLHPEPPEALLPHLARVSALFEAKLAPKPAWTIDKMTEAAMDRLMRMILPFRLEVTQVESTIKLNQNKTDPQRAGAAVGIAAHPIGLGARDIAVLMQESPPAP